MAGWITAAVPLLAVALGPVSGWIAEASTGLRPRRLRQAALSATTAGWAAATWPPDPVLAVLAVPLLVWGVALAHIDVRTHRLPDVLVLTAYPPVGGVLIAAGVATGDADRLLRSALAAAAALAAVGVLAAFGGFGFGDAKLAGLLGLVLGWVSWSAVLAAILLTLTATTVPALRALLTRGRTARFAFGPPLLLGALVAPSC